MKIVIKAVKKNVEVLGISLKKFINTVRECHGLTHNTGMEEDIENNQIDDGFPFSAFFFSQLSFPAYISSTPNCLSDMVILKIKETYNQITIRGSGR